MKRSLKGHWLPESRADAQALADSHDLSFRECVSCHRPLHTPGAASSIGGWRETQISGMCEPCFDALMEDKDD